MSPIPVLDTQSSKTLTISSEHIYVDIHFDFDNHCLQKGKQSCIADLLYNFMSYAHFSSPFHSFVSSLDSYSFPKSVSEALSGSGWRSSMQEK